MYKFFLIIYCIYIIFNKIIYLKILCYLYLFYTNQTLLEKVELN